MSIKTSEIKSFIKSKKLIFKWIAIILAAFVFSASVALFSIEDIGKALSHFKNTVSFHAEKTYGISRIVPIGYDVDGNEFITITNDSQLILDPVNQYVDIVFVQLEEPAKEDIGVEVFWYDGTQGFNSDQYLATMLREGQDYLIIPLNEKAVSLRVDIGMEENVSFKLHNIVINKNGMFKYCLRDIRSVMKRYENSFFFTERFKILFFFSIFVALCLFTGKEGRAKLFKYRWLVAGIILLFLVVNKYHGDSITLYNEIIEPSEDVASARPIFGQGRTIRTDEWVVDNPTYLSTRYLDNPYGKYNNITRATDTVNMNQIGWHTLAFPLVVLRYVVNELFGFDYGYSFYWYSRLLLTLLVNIELFLILTKNNKWLSLCASCLVVCSSYFLWWGFPYLFLAVPAALSCGYYFFNSQSLIKKIFFALGTAIFGAGYVMDLYPAWQVPLGYLALAVFAWIIYASFDRIKKMKWYEWGLVVLAFIVLCSLVLGGLNAKAEYIEAISNTVYPGERFSNGDFGLYKLFYYISGVLFGYTDVGNPSELGGFISFFPLPIILGIFYFWKKNKRDFLVNALMIVNAFLLIYCTTGIPEFLAKCTLMGYSTAGRAVDILAYAQIVLLVVVLSKLKAEDKLPIKVAAVLGVVIVCGTFIYGFIRIRINGFIFVNNILVISLIVAFVLLVSRINPKYTKYGYMILIVISLVTAVSIRPICKGLTVFDEKPVAKEIHSILSEDKDSVWITCAGGSMLSAYAIASGARTINCVNTYPNLELWHTLDPEQKYEEMYNRYEHVAVDFTDDDTSFELPYADIIVLNLSYKDIKLTNADYILSQDKLKVDNEFVCFENIYDNDGCYIYKIIYK